jgi:hypothetical protein
VELLVLVACIAFVALTGARFFGDRVSAKYDCAADAVDSLSGPMTCGGGGHSSSFEPGDLRLPDGGDPASGGGWFTLARAGIKPTRGSGSAGSDHTGASWGAAQNPGPVNVRFVTSESDKLSAGIRFLRFGAAEPADSLEGMVDSILEDADGHPIRRLIIEGHGFEGAQFISDDAAIGWYYTLRRRARARQTLARLRDAFASDAEVLLKGCNVGGGPSGEALVRDLADLWDVQVRASVTYERPLIPGYEGTEIVAIPTEDGVRIEFRESWIEAFARSGPPTGDGEVREEIAELSKSQLWMLSMRTRYRYTRELLGGYRSEADREAIMTLFETAAPGERRELYRYIEHHPWDGEFRHGWLVSDDSLWNALSHEEAERLRDLLNE